MQPRTSPVSARRTESVARLVADTTEDPRRVVDEREVVQDSESVPRDRAAAERIEEPSEVVGREGCGHRVDREVAPVEILPQPRPFDGRRRARGVVELRSCRDDVDPLVLAVGNDGGAELVVRRRPAAEHLRERVRERDRVALDGDVDVEALLAQEDVPDRAAHEVDAVSSVPERRNGLGCLVQPGEARICWAMLAAPSLGWATSPSSARSRSTRVTTPTSSAPRRTATRPSSAAVTSVAAPARSRPPRPRRRACS